MKKRLRILLVASIVLLVVAAGLFTRRNQYKNWFLYENFKDTPIRSSIVLEKQQGIHLKYRYPDKAKKNGALYVSCSEPCIHVTVSGIDGIYSNAYMIIGVEGVYKGKSVIRITDEEGKVIGELPVRVTNNPYRAEE